MWSDLSSLAPEIIFLGVTFVVMTVMYGVDRKSKKCIETRERATMDTSRDSWIGKRAFVFVVYASIAAIIAAFMIARKILVGK